MENGYLGSYLDVNNNLNKGVYIIGEMYDISLMIFLALSPKKKEVFLPLLIYFLDGILFLASGRRLDMMLNLLLILTYILLRHFSDKEKWIRLKHIVLGILSLPFIVFLLYFVGIWRTGGRFELNNIFDPLLIFFYDQGVSARVIGYSKLNFNDIPKLKFYSFGTILEFVNYKVIGNWIKGEPIPLGQTVERAMNGHIFSHTISYIAYPEEYLKGMGSGSSYIAELFVDFSYIGVIIGN